MKCTANAVSISALNVDALSLNPFNILLLIKTSS
jgi:hypothetical protein